MKPHEVHWEITNGCNLRCKHCLPASILPRVRELSTNEAMNALEAFHAAKIVNICFTGGEPFSRADFIELLGTASSLGIRSSVITNTTLLSQVVLESVKRLDVSLGISIDGSNAMTNDSIRGKGSFESAVSTLSRCLSLKIPVDIYVTITAINFNSLLDIAKLAREHGCRRIHFSEVTIAGRAKTSSNELRLSHIQKSRLRDVVTEAVLTVFEEVLSDADEECWVDGSIIYMTADGNLYVCSEVFQQCPELSIGDIRSFDLNAWPQGNGGSCVEDNNLCCYGILSSSHAVFVENIPRSCLMTNRESTIDTINQLYKALDSFYPDIEGDCEECQDLDCLGYIWLLKKESEHLYEKGVPLVQVNDGPTFIHSFPKAADGKLNLSVRYPSCSQLHPSCRKCSIYKDRPMVCRFYPIGLETQADGTIVWALHLDCLHIRRLEERGSLPSLERRALNILNRIGPKMMEEIVETYRTVDTISSFPDGENNYKPLQKVSYVKM